LEPWLAVEPRLALEPRFPLELIVGRQDGVG
jgi:hypothetical protein